PPSKFMVNVAEMQNGTLLIKNAEGTVVSPNGAVATGTVLSVVANPNRGYKLGTFLVNAKPANENASIIVTAETTIAATFVKESYPITTSDQQVTYSVAPCSKEFGTIIPKVTATVRDAKNYKLISLLVNGQPVANGSDVQVDGPTNLSAQVTKLTPITLLNEPSTEVTYNGKPQEYAVLTAEGLAGFKVTYDGDENVPTAANTYTVAITRPADDVYADFSATRSFVINKGVPGILAIPFSDKVTGTEVSGSSTVAGKWQTEKPDGTRSAAFALRAATQVIYFVPDDKNLGYVTANAVSSTNATAVTVTIAATTGGTLVLKNGTVAVTNGNTYKGQTFTIEAIPDAGYTVDQHKILVNGVAKTTFTLSGDDVTVTAADVFKAKGASTPTKTDNIFAALTYTGAPLKLDVSGAGLVGDAGKWVLTYQTSTGTSTTLTQVGTGYKVFASYQGDDQYAACAATQIGTVNIEKVVLIPNHVTLPTASAIMTGTTLSTSQLSSGEVKVNGSSIPGMFAWTSAATVINKAGNQAVTFTPTDLANYTALNDLKVYVSLRDVKKHTMTLVKVNTGTAVITDASGAEVKNGELVSEGMQLTVKAAVGSKAIDKVVVTPNVAITTDGLTTTFVTPTTDFTVTVTFKTDGEVTPPTPVVKYAVYVTSVGMGTLKVMNDTKEVKNGEEVTANTELTITATATKGNKLTSLLYNGSTIASGAKKMVTEATTISAVFT
ncbi:MAG: MBG domain-containing protein, partial [Tannerellaceae bacterium]